MIVYATIATDLVKRVNSSTGRTFYVTRLSETHKNTPDKAQFIELALNITEDKANQFEKGMFVKVVGRVYPDIFNGNPILKMSSNSIALFSTGRGC